MYEKHFGLSKNPFQSIADGKAVFEGPEQSKVVSDLKIALTANDSIAVITGPVGVGKTTIVQRALEQTGPERLVAILGRTQVGSDELVDLLLAQFGVVRESTRRSECLKAFSQILSDRAKAGDRVFIVTEDAERLGAELLEELEALTAADGGSCGGANIILMGPQKLDKLITRPSLERVRQRIRLQQTLERFTAEEVEAYLRHRITAAGGDFDAIFEPGAALMARRCSGGIPRVINSLCETALTVAAEGKVKQVSGKIIFKVAVEVFGMSPGDAPVPQALKAPPQKPVASATRPTASAPQQAPASKPPAPAGKKIPDPTSPAVTIPAAAQAKPEPAQPSAPRAPKPPANVRTAQAKPAAPPAATNGATAAPAAKSKAEPAKPANAPPKFKFADEIVVDRNTRPNLTPEPPTKADPPELPSLELESVTPKAADEKPKPATPAAAANDAASPRNAPAQVENVAAEIKKDEPVAPVAKAPPTPPVAKAPPTPPASAPAKVEEPVASFAKVDHDMLDAALADLAVHDQEDRTEPEKQVPAAADAVTSVPEVTLDQSIEAKRAGAKGATDPAELDRMVAELEEMKSLEEMSDQLAETLFGNEELEAISLQIREESTPAVESPVALEPAAVAGAVDPATPAPEAATAPVNPAPVAAPKAAPKATAASPGLADVETGSEPAAAVAPSDAKCGPQPEPIENQFNTSMTSTLETINSRNKPPDDDDDDDDDSEDSRGGLLGRLKDTFKS